VSIPKEFLKTFDYEGHSDIVIREDASTIIQDMIGVYPEKPDTVIAFSDIEEDMAWQDEKDETRPWISGARQVFSDVEHA
jgi:hypothetical protein